MGAPDLLWSAVLKSAEESRSEEMDTEPSLETERNRKPGENLIPNTTKIFKYCSIPQTGQTSLLVALLKAKMLASLERNVLVQQWLSKIPNHLGSAKFPLS